MLFEHTPCAFGKRNSEQFFVLGEPACCLMRVYWYAGGSSAPPASERRARRSALAAALHRNESKTIINDYTYT